MTNVFVTLVLNLVLFENQNTSRGVQEVEFTTSTTRKNITKLVENQSSGNPVSKCQLMSCHHKCSSLVIEMFYSSRVHVINEVLCLL